MSVKLMAKAWDSDVGGNDLLVLLALCDFANDDGELFPSLATISKKAKVCKSSLAYILKAYEEIGVITRSQRKRENGSDTSTFYKILTLEFDSKSYKKAYQKARNYKSAESPQCEHHQPHCEHPQNKENIKIVDTPDHIVDTQNANCGHLEPSYLNHHNLNHHKKYIKKENESSDLKPKDLITFYKENISNLQSKIKEIGSTNVMALCPDGLEKILIGLKNYANDLPKDKFHITNLEKFIKEKFYLDYQEATRKNAPLNPLNISGKQYTASKDF